MEVSEEQLADIVSKAVAAQLEARDEAHKAQIQQMQDRLDAALSAMANRGITTLIPAHSGGPGLTIADTWSQWEQELAHAGIEKPIVDLVKEVSKSADLQPMREWLSSLETNVVKLGDDFRDHVTSVMSRIDHIEQTAHQHPTE